MDQTDTSQKPKGSPHIFLKPWNSSERNRSSNLRPPPVTAEKPRPVPEDTDGGARKHGSSRRQNGFSSRDTRVSPYPCQLSRGWTHLDLCRPSGLPCIHRGPSWTTADKAHSVCRYSCLHRIRYHTWEHAVFANHGPPDAGGEGTRNCEPSGSPLWPPRARPLVLSPTLGMGSSQTPRSRSGRLSVSYRASSFSHLKTVSFLVLAT